MRGKISSISKRRSLRLNIPRHSGDNLPQMTHASGSCSFSLSVRHDVSDLYMSTGDLLLWRWRSLWQPWWHRCCESPPPVWGVLEGEGHMHVSGAAVTHCRWARRAILERTWRTMCPLLAASKTNVWDDFLSRRMTGAQIIHSLGRTL